MEYLRTVFVIFNLFVPRTSLTSTDANSQDNAGKLMLKSIRKKSPSALSSTTTVVVVLTVK
nr:hypothetical protein Iba_chr11eCG0580 [Ipomoea batatas]